MGGVAVRALTSNQVGFDSHTRLRFEFAVQNNYNERSNTSHFTSECPLQLMVSEGLFFLLKKQHLYFELDS
jgi:hypothetical protein